MGHISVTRRPLTDEQLRGQTIRINCPACGAQHIAAEAWFEEQVANFIWRHTTSWVRCTGCNATLFSRKSAEKLVGRTPEELESVVVQRVALPKRLLVILACTFFFWPALGLMVTIPALIALWNEPGGWRKASRIALVASLVVHALFGVMYLIMETDLFK